MSRNEGDEPEVDVDLAQFFELSLDLLTVAGFDGYFKRLNPAWTKTFGWSHEEFLSRPNIEFVHPDDREATLAARAGLVEGVPLRALVNRYVCKNGGFRWLEWRSVSYIGRGLVFAIARDVTEQRAAEAERHRIQDRLAASERMASIGRLAAGVAHEINNPLACVIGNVRAVLDEIEKDPRSPARSAEFRVLLREALEDTDRIRDIVRGLATFSRAGVERRVILGVWPVLRLALEQLYGKLHARARVVETYEETPLIRADEARLLEVFRHLLSNAAEAIAEGRPDENEIRVSTSTDAEGNAVIEIRDSGQGISTAVQSRMFEPFFTTKDVGSGTGLGLSICHNTINAMNGHIGVASEEGRGATFRVVIPPA